MNWGTYKSRFITLGPPDGIDAVRHAGTWEIYAYWNSADGAKASVLLGRAMDSVEANEIMEVWHKRFESLHTTTPPPADDSRKGFARWAAQQAFGRGQTMRFVKVAPAGINGPTDDGFLSIADCEVVQMPAHGAKLWPTGEKIPVVNPTDFAPGGSLAIVFESRDGRHYIGSWRAVPPEFWSNPNEAER